MTTAKDLNKEFLNHTRTHVMIVGTILNSIVGLAKAMDLVDLSKPIRNRHIEIGYVKYDLPDTHPKVSSYPIEKLKDILLFADAPDVFDKQFKGLDIYTRRYWHADVKEGVVGWKQAVRFWRRILNKEKEKKTTEEMLFGIAYMSHYIQDSLCPMHITLKDQDIHFDYEKYVSDHFEEFDFTGRALFYSIALSWYPRWEDYVDNYSWLVYNTHDRIVELFRKNDYDKMKELTSRILTINMSATLLFDLRMIEEYQAYIIPS